MRCKENELLTWHFLHGQKNHLAFLIFFTGSSVSFITGAYVAPDAVVTHCFFCPWLLVILLFHILKGQPKENTRSNQNQRKKAISNAYLIQPPPPPAQYWSKKKMISEYKGHKNMQEAGFIMNQLNLYKLEKCLSSQSCPFVKKYSFNIKLPHAHFQYVCNVKAKY